MALRIGGMQPPPPAAADQSEPTAPPPDMPEASNVAPTEPTGDEAPQGGQGGGVLDPTIAGYRGPDQGPFMCSNCVHFAVSGPNTCEIVSGPIDEMGVCNVFTPTPQDESQQGQQGQTEAETPAETAAPTEETPEEPKAPPAA